MGIVDQLLREIHWGIQDLLKGGRGSGAALRPRWVQGKALVGVQEAEAPESSQVLRCFKLDLTYYKNDKKQQKII